MVLPILLRVSARVTVIALYLTGSENGHTWNLIENSWNLTECVESSTLAAKIKKDNRQIVLLEKWIIVA